MGNLDGIIFKKLSDKELNLINKQNQINVENYFKELIKKEEYCKQHGHQMKALNGKYDQCENCKEISLHIMTIAESIYVNRISNIPMIHSK